MSQIFTAVLLSLVAGMGTGLGGLIAVIRRPGPRAYGFLMGITAGVMISLSFLELVSKAWELQGFLTTTVGFSLGAIFMFLLDVTIPHVRFTEQEIPHQEQDDCIEAVEKRGHRRHRFGRIRAGADIDERLLKSRKALPQPYPCVPVAYAAGILFGWPFFPDSQSQSEHCWQLYSWPPFKP
jgi:zinc transporter ZupT